MTFVSGDILYQSIAKIAASYNAMGALSIAAYDFENRFSVADAASVVENTNLSISRIDAILNNVNLSDSKASQIIYATDIAIRDLSSISNIIGTMEIVDDWSDNKLTSRDSNTTTPISISSPYAQEITTFRPEWTQVTGTTAVTDGHIVQDEVDEEITTPSTFTVGTWEIEFTDVTTGTDYGRLQPMMTTTDYYDLQWRRDGESYAFQKNGSSIIAGSNWSGGTDPHIAKVTRDGDGNFELFLDGVSYGTVTNMDITTSDNIGIRSNDGGTTNYDDLKVY